MAFVTIIQARMSSGRLPGKVLKPLGNSTVLDQVIRRCQLFSDQVVVATSTDVSDDPIEAHVAIYGDQVILTRGPLDDVFSRFRQALLDPRVKRGDWFARATADCPLLSVPMARSMRAACAADWDYVCTDLMDVPRGTAIECVRRSAFLDIDPGTLDAPEREHVTLRMYERPGTYRCLRLPASDLGQWARVASSAGNCRLTVDYPEDYALMQALFARDADVTAEQAVQMMAAEPGLARINRGCVQKQAR